MNHLISGMAIGLIGFASGLSVGAFMPRESKSECAHGFTKWEMSRDGAYQQHTCTNCGWTQVKRTEVIK